MPTPTVSGTNANLEGNNSNTRSLEEAPPIFSLFNSSYRNYGSTNPNNNKTKSEEDNRIPPAGTKKDNEATESKKEDSSSRTLSGEATWTTTSGNVGTFHFQGGDIESGNGARNNANATGDEAPCCCCFSSNFWITSKKVFEILGPLFLCIFSLCFIVYFLVFVKIIETYSPEMRLLLVGLLVVTVRHLYGQDLRTQTQAQVAG